jgi:hypothetical protein
MKNLSNNWLTEGLIDFEYKKYVLLAYFQAVNEHFNQNRLYPILSDLVFHYQNLQVLKSNKQLMKEAFPERLTSTDFDNLKLVYEKIVDDDDMMNEIEAIINFSLPEFNKYLAEGKEIYEFFESKMNISPIGLASLYADEGYLFIAEAEKKDIKIYEYQMTIFHSANEKYRGVHTHYLESQKKGLANSYENMKVDIIKKYHKNPNPATYLVYSKVDCPLNESFLPIAKRLLVKHISSTGY